MTGSRGLLITFEGGEGAGKTTLINRLSQELEKMGHPVLRTRAPGSLKLGEKIRDLLLHSDDEEITPRSELFLFLADRASHVEREIRPALESGRIVLCDRFNDSTIAYQGFARGLGPSQVVAFCDFACNGLKPDLTFYLDLDPEIGLQRAKHLGPSDRIESERPEFHRKIREAYLLIAKQEPKRVHVLNAAKPPEQVYNDARHLLDSHFLQTSRS